MGSGGQAPRPGSRGDRLGQQDDEVRSAIRFAAVTACAGVAFVAVAALWVSACGGPAAADTVACGPPYRTVLALGGPLILMGGGLWAFARTYRVWRDRGTWWGWQGAGWFLLSLMLVVLTMTAPPIISPMFGG